MFLNSFETSNLFFLLTFSLLDAKQDLTEKKNHLHMEWKGAKPKLRNRRTKSRKRSRSWIIFSATLRKDLWYNVKYGSKVGLFECMDKIDLQIHSCTKSLIHLKLIFRGFWAGSVVRPLNPYMESSPWPLWKHTHAKRASVNEPLEPKVIMLNIFFQICDNTFQLSQFSLSNELKWSKILRRLSDY